MRWLLHAAAGSILAHVINTEYLADSRRSIAQPDLANGTRFQVLMKDRLTADKDNNRLNRPAGKALEIPGAARGVSRFFKN